MPSREREAPQARLGVRGFNSGLHRCPGTNQQGQCPTGIPRRGGCGAGRMRGCERRDTRGRAVVPFESLPDLG